MNVVTFEGYVPVPRQDGLPWTSLRIEEAAAAGGPFAVIETIDMATGVGDAGPEVTLSPVGLDTDPADPLSRDFTTEEAALAQGWYRVVFVDANGDESTTAAVYRAAAPDDPRRPSVDAVALLMRTRTVAGVATGLGADTGPSEFTSWDDTTRPTRTEAQAVINTAYDAMLGQLRVELTEPQYEAFSHVVALYAAVLIEVSYFRESANDRLIDIWRETIESALEAIATAIEREDPVGTGSGYGMGTITVGTTREKVLPDADRMVGIDWDDAAGSLP